MASIFFMAGPFQKCVTQNIVFIRCSFQGVWPLWGRVRFWRLQLLLTERDLCKGGAKGGAEGNRSPTNNSQVITQKQLKILRIIFNGFGSSTPTTFFVLSRAVTQV
jgi:hypothetical protein